LGHFPTNTYVDKSTKPICNFVAACILPLSSCIVQVVRENNEAQGRALDDAAAETKRLKQRVKELADLLDAETDARNLASQELEVWSQTEHL
jgi:hypothetical protein